MLESTVRTFSITTKIGFLCLKKIIIKKKLYLFCKKHLKMDLLTDEYWNSRYQNDDFGWDLGKISPPLKTYFETLKNKKLRILIPGAGSAYEAEYLYQLGFEHVYVIDYAKSAIERLNTRFPEFPESNCILGDFFQLDDHFDLIIEQTFFCAIDPKFQLLNIGGKLVGLLLDDVLNLDKPPFGGSKAEYISYFANKFEFIHFESCYNSITPRMGRELFIEFLKK